MKIQGLKNQILDTLNKDLNDIDIYVVDYKLKKGKRSLDANGFYWSLLSDLCHHFHYNMWLKHQENIFNYGYTLDDSDGLPIVIKLPNRLFSDGEVKKLNGLYLKEMFVHDDHTEYIAYLGSSMLSSTQFSHFLQSFIDEIDGCDCGIDTKDAEWKRIENELNNSKH